jgi:DNA-binding CsgD family transcriptional regulator
VLTAIEDLSVRDTHSLHSLVHALAEHAEAQQARRKFPTLPSEEATDSLLLDVEWEGVRCMLLRKSATREGDFALSPRELEIAELVSAGHSNKIIAATLDISVWTVGTYLRRIFAKVGVGSRAAMVSKLSAHPLRSAAAV